MNTKLTLKQAKAKLAKEPQHTVACSGEAHSNAHIDNCNLCAPSWGKVTIPARFANVHDYREALWTLCERY